MLMLVGNFAKAKYLENAYKELAAKWGLQIYVPWNPDITVLQGAVIRGRLDDKETKLKEKEEKWNQLKSDLELETQNVCLERPHKA